MVSPLVKYRMIKDAHNNGVPLSYPLNGIDITC